MIPSTTRASRAYSNDGYTVTALARLTQQSFPTNKTLNTGPLAPSPPSEYCSEHDTSRKKLHSGLYLPFTHTYPSVRFHLEDNRRNVSTYRGDDFRFLVRFFSKGTYFIKLRERRVFMLRFADVHQTRMWPRTSRLWGNGAEDVFSFYSAVATTHSLIFNSLLN